MKEKRTAKMHFKIHRSCRNVVSVCDSDILGKRFEEGKMQLDLRENFYKGEEFEREDIVAALKRQAFEDSTFNIAGKNSVGAAIEAGIITKENIGKVQGIPFALALR